MNDLFRGSDDLDRLTLTISRYAEKASRTDRFQDDATGLRLALLGLFGETGSLVAEVKKRQRGDRPNRAYKTAVQEELGDCLWYLFAVLRRIGIPCERAFQLPLKTGFSEETAEKFSDYQDPFHEAAGTDPTTISKAAIKLSAVAGVLCDEDRNWDQPDAIDRIREFVSALASVASVAKIAMQDAAVANLSKIEDRWPEQRAYPAFFDAKEPEDERFPDKMVLDIFERKVGNKTFVYQRCNGINIGDPLTDNKEDPDDYRFHDVFHYAYAAILGWSPVLRALFKLKRKSNPKKDENQDGARAILIEEGISTWVFEQARHQDLFEHVEAGNLSYDLLKTVKQFVAGYEAEQCPLWLWEVAILEGFRCFRFLKQHRRGRVTLNLKRRSVEIRELA